MSFQSCPQIASIAIQGSSNGKLVANVLHAHFPTSYVLADIQTLNTSVASAVVASYPGLMSANLLLTQQVVTGLENLNDFQDTASFSSAPGTASGLPLPGNNSLVCTLRSALTGRSARGRIYTFPTGAGNLASGGLDQYTTGYVAAVEAFWQSVSAAIATSGWTHVILSRFTAKVERTVGIGFNVTNVTCRNDTADSQRRRLPKGH